MGFSVEILVMDVVLNPFILMNFPIHIDAIYMGLPIVHFEGSQADFS